MGAKARADLEAARAKHGVRPALGGRCAQCGAENPAEEMHIRGGPRNGSYLVCSALPCGALFAGEADFSRSFCGPRIRSQGMP
jgi:hypothetical protein